MLLLHNNIVKHNKSFYGQRMLQKISNSKNGQCTLHTHTLSLIYIHTPLIYMHTPLIYMHTPLTCTASCIYGCTSWRCRSCPSRGETRGAGSSTAPRSLLCRNRSRTPRPPQRFCCHRRCRSWLQQSYSLLSPTQASHAH